jgi:hypothetical protein
MEGDAGRVFLADLVAFCRHVRPDIYELGVQFVVQSQSPTISGDATGFLKEHDWATQSLREKQAGRLTPGMIGSGAPEDTATPVAVEAPVMGHEPQSR